MSIEANLRVNLNNKPLSTIFKESLEQRIEDEIDLKAILEYEESLKNNEVEYIYYQAKQNIPLKGLYKSLKLPA